MDRVDFETNRYLDQTSWDRQEEIAFDKAVLDRATKIAEERIVDICGDGVADNLYNLQIEWRDFASFNSVKDVTKLSLEQAQARLEAMNNLIKSLEILLIDSAYSEANSEVRRELSN